MKGFIALGLKSNNKTAPKDIRVALLYSTDTALGEAKYSAILYVAYFAARGIYESRYIDSRGR